MAPLDEPLQQPHDPELGITTGEDTDWGPAQIRLAAPVAQAITVGRFLWMFPLWGLYRTRIALLKWGVARGKRRYL